jgi:hypothetical protein
MAIISLILFGKLDDLSEMPSLVATSRTARDSLGFCHAHSVAVQVAFERHILKPVFQLDRL